jgi:voltage-gated potassium channel
MDRLRLRLRVFIILLFVIVIVGTFSFMFVEGLPLVDAFYFSIVTITTVGYGDIHPATQLGKIIAVVLIITGAGAFLGVVANATEILLNKRERKIREQKLNMVVGVFFSELGGKILSCFTRYDPQLDVIRKNLVVENDWSEKDFLDVRALLDRYDYKVDPQKVRLQDLKSLLEQNGYLLLTLWENPNLLEHEAFTETLRAILHLKEELLSREDLTGLPDSDMAHIAGDINRAYALISRQWLDYMKHLKDSYPYLFSHAMRTNPFDKEASPIVR